MKENEKYKKWMKSEKREYKIDERNEIKVQRRGKLKKM